MSTKITDDHLNELRIWSGHEVCLEESRLMEIRAKTILSMCKEIKKYRDRATYEKEKFDQLYKELEENYQKQAKVYKKGS